MNSTGNYQLNQWDPEDRILRTDFNSDNEKVDAALKTLDQAVSTKAAQSSLTLLQQSLSAETSARTALANSLNSEISARKAADSALEKTVELQLIRKDVTTEESKLITYDLTDIDWSKWRRVHFAIFPTGATSRFFLYLNSTDGTQLAELLVSRWRLLTVTPLYKPDLLFTGMMEGEPIIGKYFFREINAMVLIADSNQTLAIGNQLEIWGEA